VMAGDCYMVAGSNHEAAMLAKITKRSVDAATPQGRDHFTWDSELRGFALKVTPAGRKVYIVHYRMGGRATPVRRYTIGQHGAIGPDGMPLTADRARDEAAKQLGRVANGVDPARVKRATLAEHRAYGEAPTVSEFADIYLERHARPLKKKRSVEEDERNLRLHIRPALGRLKVRDVTAADIAKFHAGRSNTPTNANRCLSLLSHMLEKAAQWAERPAGDNPCRHIGRYAERLRDRFLSSDELARLADALSKAETDMTEPPAAINAIRLLMLTGCRVNEILSLRWDFIDDARGCFRLPDSKSGAKAVPVGAPALRLLSTIPRQAESTFVLPADRGSGHFVGIQRVWQRIRKAAGLEEVRLHDLRHSYASVAVAGGDSLFLVGKVLGHRQSQTTERYAHVKDDPLIAVADRTSKRIADAMGLLSGGERAAGAVVSLRGRQ
jgi:integrase